MADIIMKNLRNKRIIVVENCISCPFAGIECSDVYCTGMDRRKHTYIGLTQQVVNESIPDWCPLPAEATIKGE